MSFPNQCFIGAGTKPAVSSAARTFADAIEQLLRRRDPYSRDVKYGKQPIRFIVPDKDSGIVLENIPVWDRIRETVAKHGYDPACIGTLERMQF